MELLKFNAARCDLCGICIKTCPFDSLHMGERSIEVDDTCKMCSACINTCPQDAIQFEQKSGSADKSTWRDILIFVEQQNGVIHPVAFELIGEALKLAQNVGYRVNAMIIGGNQTERNATKLLPYGVEKVYVYQHEELENFKVDSYTNAAANCISIVRPSVVLVGATALGRSLAPRLSTRFHTGLTADCTALEMRDNTDLVQIRPAFGGNVMAQILIGDSRPQFATVRYKVMDTAAIVENPTGSVIICPVKEDIFRSRITVLESQTISHNKSIEEEEILVVAGRGAKDEKTLEMLRELADILGGQLCFTRPMVELGNGDTAHQIGLSGRTVKPNLILTFGVSGAIQFASCMKSSQCIVAVNSDPQAQIFNIANYCIVDDVQQIIPQLLSRLKSQKEVKVHAVSL